MAGEGAADVLLTEMRQRFQAWSQGRSNNRLSASAGPDEKLNLSANVAGLVPQGNVIVDLISAIDRVMPARSWQLAGTATLRAGARVASPSPSRRETGKILSSRDAPAGRLPGRAANSATERPERPATITYRRLSLRSASSSSSSTDRDHQRVATSATNLPQDPPRLAPPFAITTSAATSADRDLQTAQRLYRQAVARHQGYNDAQFGLAVVDLRLRLRPTRTRSSMFQKHARQAARAPRVREAGLPCRTGRRFWRVVVRIPAAAIPDAWDRGGEALRTDRERVVEPAESGSRLRCRRARVASSLVPLASALAATRRSAPDPLAAHLRTKLTLDAGT